MFQGTNQEERAQTWDSKPHLTIPGREIHFPNNVTLSSLKTIPPQHRSSCSEQNVWPKRECYYCSELAIASYLCPTALTGESLWRCEGLCRKNPVCHSPSWGTCRGAVVAESSPGLLQWTSQPVHSPSSSHRAVYGCGASLQCCLESRHCQLGWPDPDLGTGSPWE